MSIVGICLGGYTSGLLLAQYLYLSPPPALLFCGLLFAVLLFLHKPRAVYFILLLFCLLIGLLRYPAQLAPDAISSQLDSLIDQGPVRLTGKVLAVHERPNGKWSIDLVLQEIEVKGFVIVAGARLRLYIDRPGKSPLPGSRLAFRSKIRRTRNFGIPGEFDFVRHLAYLKIWHTAFLPDTRGIAFFADNSARPIAYIGSLRQQGLEFIKLALPGDKAILLKALLLGEKGAMPKTLRQQLAAGGVAHLFAISGLHLGLLAFLIYALLKYFYSRSTRLSLWHPPARILWLLILPPLFGYLLLTGDALATRRAFYALLIVVFLYLARRRTKPLRLLFSLVFLFLIFEPLAFWQPSFLLSFSGALGILLWQKPLMQLLQPCPGLLRYVLQLLGVSTAAFIATLPATVFIFHLFSPASILSNLLAIPLVSLAALPMGLAGLLIFPLFPTVGSILLQLAARVLQLVVDLSTLVTSIPGFSARVLYLSLPEIMALLLLCLVLLIGWQRRKVLLLLIPAVALLVYTPDAAMIPELTLFSVGQGESILLRVEGKTLLIDGGGLRSDSFDVGERLLAPALGRLGVKSLDAIILTHDHPDHSGGLNFIVNNFPVREFWSTLEIADLQPELLQALVGRGVKINTYNVAGWGSAHPGGLKTTSLFIAPLKTSRKNDMSLCLYLPTPAGGILLTGDLEAAGVEALSKSHLPGPVGLIKIPHHGSAGSNPAQLISELQPKVVIVSAGYNNPYHFPSQQLLSRAAAQHIPVWRTDLDGTVRIRQNGQHWQAEHWVNGLFY